MIKKSANSIFKQSIKQSLRPYLETDISKYISHVFISIIIGVLAGGGAIAFHHVLYITRTFFRPDNFRAKFDIPFFFIILIPVAGGILSSLLTWLYPLIAREKGVLSVIKAIIIKKGFIPLKETLFHFLAPVISIGTGAPLGPEGPSAKIGSGIGSYMSQLFRHSSNDMIMYTAAGGGAAIAAVFNAPIAGVFFGIEVILLNDLKNRALSALIIAAVMADLLSRTILGSHNIFTIPLYNIGDIYTYPFYILLGILCGIISIIYFKLSEFIKVIYEEKLKVTNPFYKLIPVTLIFGFFLVYQYDLFGIGYIAINRVLQGSLLPHQVLQILVLKIIFLALFLQAGAFGGSFAPALSIGTFLGYLMAITANTLLGTSLDPVAFALIGMGGVLAGINSIPLTSILLVFEVTGDYNFILPLMLAAVISHLAILYHRKGSEYSIALLNENIDVTKKGDLDLFGKMTVGSVLQIDMDVVDYTTPFKDVVRIIMDARYGDVFVTDHNKKLVGVITLKDVRQALLDNDLTGLLIAGDLVIKIPPVKIYDPVSIAIAKIREYDIENIPVVVSEENSEFVGIVNHRDIIETYYKTLDDISMSEFLL